MPGPKHNGLSPAIRGARPTIKAITRKTKAARQGEERQASRARRSWETRKAGKGQRARGKGRSKGKCKGKGYGAQGKGQGEGNGQDKGRGMART